MEKVERRQRDENFFSIEEKASEINTKVYLDRIDNEKKLKKEDNSLASLDYDLSATEIADLLEEQFNQG